jgi:hypothetical protein
MSKSDQPLGDLAGAREHHLEPLGRRQSPLIAQLELELLILAGRDRIELQDGRHTSLSAEEPAESTRRRLDRQRRFRWMYFRGTRSVTRGQKGGDGPAADLRFFLMNSRFSPSS